MRYMLLVYRDEHALNESEREECYKESALLSRDLCASGNYLAAAPLHPTATATSIRVLEIAGLPGEALAPEMVGQGRELRAGDR
jgi:hypothetical protein